jgi:DNA-binding XRE family transcriptional regulator
MPVPKMYRKPRPITRIIDGNKTIEKIYNLYSIYNSIGTKQLKENFRRTLQNNNILPGDVIEVLKLSRNTMYAYANDSNKSVPSLELLVRICVEFQINIEDFLEKDE